MAQESNYIGGTSFTHKHGPTEVTIMLEEVTEESSTTPVYFVSTHTENKAIRSNRIDSTWYETLEEAQAHFYARIRAYANNPYYVRESFID